MEVESLGKLLPRILVPYAQQWAERSGLTLLSRLLVDTQFKELIEKYGDELVALMAKAGTRTFDNGHGVGNGFANGNGRTNGGKHLPVEWPRDVAQSDADFTNLQDRVLAMEAAQEAQQALFEVLRTKIRPLALALGCCPECLVGVQACPKCWGRSTVGKYEPDYALLESHVIDPLAARGVPLVLKKQPAPGAQQPSEASATKARRKPWPKK